MALHLTFRSPGIYRTNTNTPFQSDIEYTNLAYTYLTAKSHRYQFGTRYVTDTIIDALKLNGIFKQHRVVYLATNQYQVFLRGAQYLIVREAL